MPNVIKLAAAAVAVLVVAVVGFQLLPAPGGVGGPAATPAPTPAPTPVPTHAPTPSPAHRHPGRRHQSAPLVAGTYRVPDPFIAVHDLVSGAVDDLSGRAEPGSRSYRTEPANFAPALMIDRVHRVFADPCHPDPASSTAVDASRHPSTRSSPSSAP